MSSSWAYLHLLASSATSTVQIPYTNDNDSDQCGQTKFQKGSVESAPWHNGLLPSVVFSCACLFQSVTPLHSKRCWGCHICLKIRWFLIFSQTSPKKVFFLCSTQSLLLQYTGDDQAQKMSGFQIGTCAESLKDTCKLKLSAWVTLHSITSCTLSFTVPFCKYVIGFVEGLINTMIGFIEKSSGMIGLA